MLRTRTHSFISSSPHILACLSADCVHETMSLSQLLCRDNRVVAFFLALLLCGRWECLLRLLLQSSRHPNSEFVPVTLTISTFRPTTVMFVSKRQDHFHRSHILHQVSFIISGHGSYRISPLGSPISATAIRGPSNTIQAGLSCLGPSLYCSHPSYLRSHFSTKAPSCI
jgi:hypothetical protein